MAAPAYLAAHEASAHPRELARHCCISWRQQAGAAPYHWEFAKDGEQIAVAVEGPLIEDWSPCYPGFFAYYHRNRHTSAATRAVVAFLRKVPGDRKAMS